MEFGQVPLVRIYRERLSSVGGKLMSSDRTIPTVVRSLTDVPNLVQFVDALSQAGDMLGDEDASIRKDNEEKLKTLESGTIKETLDAQNKAKE